MTLFISELNDATGPIRSHIVARSLNVSDFGVICRGPFPCVPGVPFGFAFLVENSRTIDADVSCSRLLVESVDFKGLFIRHGLPCLVILVDHFHC